MWTYEWRGFIRTACLIPWLKSGDSPAGNHLIHFNISWFRLDLAMSSSDEDAARLRHIYQGRDNVKGGLTFGFRAFQIQQNV